MEDERKWNLFWTFAFFFLKYWEDAVFTLVIRGSMIGLYEGTLRLLNICVSYLILELVDMSKLFLGFTLVSDNAHLFF